MILSYSYWRALTLTILLASSLFSSAAETATSDSGPKKTCFQCQGTGTELCRGPGCVGGKKQCPNPCLKPNVGVWKHKNVAGHSPNELWQEFHYTLADGRSGTAAWTQAHLGEVIVTKPGQDPQNVGKCPVCSGAMKVDCTVCKGSAKMPCHICGGAKMVPESWTAENNPKHKAAAVAAGFTNIKLKNGTTINGKIAARMDNAVMVKTSSGEMIKIASDDIVSEGK